MEEFHVIEDELGRKFKTLRLSVTPICNFACEYCVGGLETHTGKTKQYNTKLDTFKKYVYEIHRILNLHKVRLTGGEPLLYHEISQLIRILKEEIGIPHVSLTTNGSRLEKVASALKQSGLDSLNLSLDAIDSAVFYKMSKRNRLDEVIKGLQLSLEAGIQLKLNCTVMRGFNESQILPLLEFSGSRKIPIRYLEFMQMGAYYQNYKSFLVSQDEILSVISHKYKIRELGRKKSSTSYEYETEEGYLFGIIANESSPFCKDCDRLRLDSKGVLYGCLSSNHGFPLEGIENLREVLPSVLQKAIFQKQKERFIGSPITMISVGG